MNTILLIEDDTALRENTAELLELSEYNVLTASNGKIGIEIAKKEIPDIIVCDIMMPEIDGYGVIEELSTDPQTSQIPFIFLSAKTERKEIRKGMDMGADDYLTKPFEEEELISAIESRLAKSIILKKNNNNDTSALKNNKNSIENLNALKNYIDDYGEELSFLKGEYIFTNENYANKIFLITKGVVKGSKMNESGKEVATALYKEDEFIGITSFFENVYYQESAITIENTKVTAIPKTALKKILERNNLIAIEFMEVLTENLSNIKEQLLQMAYCSVKRKTAQTILQFAKILHKKDNEDIRISRNDLASVAGIATESLIRTLSSFKKEGLIEIEGRNIRILNLKSLELIN